MYYINGDKMNIYDMTYNKLCDFLIEQGEKKSRAEIIMNALYRGNTNDLSLIPIPEKAKRIITDNFEIPPIECIDISDGETAVKYLFRLSDGNLIETVLMRHE